MRVEYGAAPNTSTRNQPMAPPTPAPRRPRARWTNRSDCRSSTRATQQRMNAPTTKAQNDENGGHHGEPVGRRVDTQLFTARAWQRQVGVAHEIDGESFG